MTKVSRNDLFARDERGPEWFNDFLYNFAATKPSSVQEILSAIYNKRGETVESVVQSYREQVGLDSLNKLEETETVKTASTEFRPLSIRHAATHEGKSVVQMIKDDQHLQSEIDSHCEHSGGTKNIESLLSFLRNRLGGDVSFSDKELREYLEGRKNHFKHDVTQEKDSGNVGLVGVSPSDQYDDDMADYATHDGNG